MGTTHRKAAQAAGHKARVQNTSSVSHVAIVDTILHRVVVANANAAVQTLTLADTNGTVQVIQVPATTTLSLTYDVLFPGLLDATPSHANIDAVLLYD